MFREMETPLCVCLLYVCRRMVLHVLLQKFIIVEYFYEDVDKWLKKGDIKRMWTMYTKPQHQTVPSIRQVL